MRNFNLLNVLAITSFVALISCGESTTKSSADKVAETDSAMTEIAAEDSSENPVIPATPVILATCNARVDLKDAYTKIWIVQGELFVRYKDINGTPTTCSCDLTSANGAKFVKNFSGNDHMVRISSGAITGGTNQHRDIAIANGANVPWISGVENYVAAGNTGNLRFIGIEDVRGNVPPGSQNANPMGTIIDFLGSTSGVKLVFSGNTYTAHWNTGNVTSPVAINYAYDINVPPVNVFTPDPGQDNALDKAARYYYADVFY